MQRIWILQNRRNVMDNKFYVSFEVARLLKEKGYNRECIAYYQNGEFHPYSVDLFKLSINDKNAAPFYMNQYSAPTKAEAIDWLESNGIMISVVYDNLGIIGKKHYRSIIDTLDKDGSESGLPIYLPSYDGDIRHYSTRLEAEDAAIIKALELL